ncbi:MAG: MlaD family protein [Syntrophales bacterium]|jgi:phospholipid/cholesterol/gamma-HCH transport system substrate-binding protein|nr:MlaD family protein [Syntrophales bacterium]
MRLSTEAKVGLFVLVGLIILGYMSFRVGQGGIGLKEGYVVEAVFDNVAGLNKDASVQIAGVEVGRVESIKLKDGKAVIQMRITPEVKLEKDVRAAVKTHGVLGDKYVEIMPGHKSQGYMESGDSIQQVERAADIDRLLQQFSVIADDIRGVTGSLNRVLGGQAGVDALNDILDNTRQLTRNLNAVVVNNEATLKAMLENTRQLTSNLNRVVVQNDEKVGQVFDGLKSAASQMEKTFASLNEITEGVRRGEGSVGQLLKDPTTTQRLNQTLASLQQISDKINEGKGTIGKLINEEETVNNLNAGLSGINRYVTKAEQFRTYLSYRGEYLFDKSDMKSYLDLRIQPKDDKFYILGIASDPRGRRTTRESTTGGVTTRTEEWDRSGLLFNIQIGKRYRDLALRGGLMESTGGVGIDYFAMNDRLRFSFEAFDFSYDRKAHLKATAEYQLFKHLYLTAGWDDFISDQGNSSIFGGFAIRFEDDDLKYMLTSTPIPK